MNPRNSLDRRDFVISSLVTVGTSAALVTASEVADAQTSAAPAATSQGTVYTGDVIQGKKVVSALDVGDLDAGAEAPLVFSGRADAYRAALVRLCDRRQRSSTWQAHRPDQRRTWRRDKFGAYGSERDEPARSGGDVGDSHGGS